MEIEKILGEIINEYDHAKVDILFESLQDHWLYFFFNEPKGKNTRPGDENVVVILQTDKENPIIVPLIKDENGCNGVLYTNGELAKKSAEINCKIGKMKGKNAFNMFYGMKGVDSVFIQGNYGNILPRRSDLAKFSGLA